MKVCAFIFSFATQKSLEATNPKVTPTASNSKRPSLFSSLGAGAAILNALPDPMPQSNDVNFNPTRNSNSSNWNVTMSLLESLSRRKATPPKGKTYQERQKLSEQQERGSARPNDRSERPYRNNRYQKRSPEPMNRKDSSNMANLANMLVSIQPNNEQKRAPSLDFGYVDTSEGDDSTFLLARDGNNEKKKTKTDVKKQIVIHPFQTLKHLSDLTGVKVATLLSKLREFSSDHNNMMSSDKTSKKAKQIRSCDAIDKDMATLLVEEVGFEAIDASSSADTRFEAGLGDDELERMKWPSRAPVVCIMGVCLLYTSHTISMLITAKLLYSMTSVKLIWQP
jgi:hypothetical protein